MSAAEDLRFLRNFQRLVDEGQFVSTYKFALLQALADLAVERDADPDGSLRLPVTAIAEKFIEYYWRQALPFRPDQPHDRSILKQNNEGQAAIVSLVLAARTRADGRLAVARANATHWQELQSEVAAIVRQMPLWKLRRPPAFSSGWH